MKNLGRVGAAGLVACALVLSACSSGGSGEQSSGTAAASGDDINLVIQDYYSEPQISAMGAIYDDCAEKVGVSVSPSHVPTDGFIAKVLQQLSSQTLPDVLMINNTNVQQLAAAGALAPLEEYGLSGDGYAESALNSGTFEDTLYAVPPVLNSIALFYNKDILDAAGVTPPTTWDELKEAAKKLTDGDQYGYAFSAIATDEGTWTFLPFMWSNGGDETTITDEGTVEALDYVASMVKEGYASASVLNWTQADTNQQFLEGKAAMMINGPWQIPSMDEAGINWGAVTIPVKVAGEKPQAPVGGETFAVPINKDAAKMEKSAEFVKCITDPEHSTIKAEDEKAVPALTEAADAFGADHPELASFVEIVANGRSRTVQLADKWPDTEKALYTALQDAITGKSDAKTALESAAAELK